MLVYQAFNFPGIRTSRNSEWPHSREMSVFERAREASKHQKRFNLLREVRKVREFRLAICANVWDPVGEYAVRTLREAVEEGKAKQVFTNFSSEPSVAYNPRWDLQTVMCPL